MSEIYKVCFYTSHLTHMVKNKDIYFLVCVCLLKYIFSPTKALQEHQTSDKHFGEPSSDLDNTTTHLSPHDLNPQDKQLEAKIMNK